MTKSVALRSRVDLEGDSQRNRELYKKIRDRCEECYVPRCWKLRDPDDDGQIYLDRHYIDSPGVQRRGEYVQLRRLMFMLTFKQQPPLGRLIKMMCDEPLCINPTHMRVKGFEPPYSIMSELIYNKKWITAEQAHGWWARTQETHPDLVEVKA